MTGGMAMNLGANFQAEVAAFLAVLALANDTTQYHEELGAGSQIVRVGAEQNWPVDDIAVWFESGAMAFIQVKSTLNSSADPDSSFAEVLDQIVRQVAHGRGRLAGQALEANDRVVLFLGEGASSPLRADLRDALRRLRLHPPTDSIEYVGQGQAAIQTQLDRAMEHVRRRLHSQGHPDGTSDARSALEHLHVIAGSQDEIRDRARLILEAHVVRSASDAITAFELLARWFGGAAQNRVSYDVRALRSKLRAAGIELREPPAILDDVAKLERHTEQVLRAEKRTLLTREGAISIERTCVSTIVEGLRQRSMVLTSEAGAGKSGILLEVAKRIRESGGRVVFLDASDPSMIDPMSALHLSQPLEEILAIWGDDEAPSYLLIDGFDALRLGAAFYALVAFLRRVQSLTADWHVAVACREYDLIHSSTDMAKMFPAPSRTGVGPDSADPRFPLIAHAVIRSLSDGELEQAFALSPSLRTVFSGLPIRASALFRSIFNLSVVADMVRVSDNLPDLSEIRERGQLLGLWWERRIAVGGQGAAKDRALQDVCQLMLASRQLRVPQADLTSGLDAIEVLLSADVLVHPDTYRTMLTFRHALIFDYAVFRLLLTVDQGIEKTLGADHDCFLFILPSLRMTFARLWENDRHAFFSIVTRLFGTEGQRTTLLMVVAHIVYEHLESVADVTPLLDSADPGSDGIVSFLVRSLIYSRQSGRGRVGEAHLWPTIAMAMAERLPRREHDMLLLLSHLTDSSDDVLASLSDLGIAARLAIVNRLDSPIYNQGLMTMALGAFIATYDGNPLASRPLLNRLIASDRISKCGHLELQELTSHLERLRDVGALSALYAAIFADIEVSNATVRVGGPSTLMGFVQDGRQSLSMARWSLAQRFADFLREEPQAAVGVLSGILNVQARDHLSHESWISVRFAGKEARMLRDVSNIWDQRIYNTDNWFTMAQAFETALRADLDAGSLGLFQMALEHLMDNPSSAFLWRMLLRNAALATEAATALAPMLESRDALMAYELREPIAVFLRNSYSLLPDETRRLIDNALLALTDDESEKPYRRDLQRVYLSSIPPDAGVDPRLHALSQHGAEESSEPEGISESRELVLNGGVIGEATFSRIALNREVRQAGGSPELLDAISEVEGLFFADQRPDNTIPLTDPARNVSTLDALSRSCSSDVRKATLDILAALIRIGLEKKTYAEDGLDDAFRLLCEATSASAHLDDADAIAREVQFADHPSWGSPSGKNDGVQALWALYRQRPDNAVLDAIVPLADNIDPAVRFLTIQGAAYTQNTNSARGWELIERGVADVNPSVVSAALRSMSYLPGASVERRTEILLAAYDRLHVESPRHALTVDLLRWLGGRVVEFGDETALQRIEPIVGQPWLHGEDAATLAFYLANRAAGDASLTHSLEASRCLVGLVASAIGYANTQLELRGGDADGYPEPERGRVNSAIRVLKEVAERLYYSSGVLQRATPAGPFVDSGTIDRARLDIVWPVLVELADFPFSGTAYYVVKTLTDAISVAPGEILRLGSRAISNGVFGGLTRESLAEDDVRAFVHRYIVGYRGILEQDRDALRAILNVIDSFVAAGWPKWIEVVFELDRLYREE